MIRTLKPLTATAVAIALIGCETPTASRPSLTTTLEYRLPVLTPLEPNKQDQEKDGIRISVAPYSYTPKQTTQREYRRVATLLLINNQFPAEVRETPHVEVYPGDIRFKVKIYNQLERVLRLAGTVVSFQVAGKTVAVSKAHYDDFLSGIILPRQEGEYEISGPDLDALSDNSTIAFFLYDIVTATDAAGNPTKRSNFEFFYTFSRQTKTQEAPTGVRRISLNQVGAALLMQRDQAQPGQWVTVPELDREMNTRGGR
jgi:hypothetical protein